MSGLQQAIGWAGTLQLCALCAVLLVRGHHRRAPLFTLYAGGVGLSSLLLGVAYTWRIHARDAWMVHQVTAAALRFGVALELTYTIFGGFPAAAQAARRATFALLVVTALTAMYVSGADLTYTDFNAVVVPRLATGTVWILTMLAALVLWYRLPLAPIPRAILLGYAPYLLVFSVAMSVLSSVGWHLWKAVGYVDTLCFFVLVNYWCRVAWRSAPDAISLTALPVAHAGFPSARAAVDRQ